MEVQKGDDQVTLLESTRHCFMPLVIPAARGSSSVAAAEVSALTEEGQEDVAPEDAYLELADPDEGTTTVRHSEEEVVTEQPKKVKKKRLLKPVGFHFPDWEQLAFPFVAPSSQESEGFLESFAQTNLRICTTVESSSTLGIPVDTTAAAITFTRAAAIIFCLSLQLKLSNMYNI
ncbi:hypothetical protein Tco_1349088 [Tanacetum coccineum]